MFINVSKSGGVFNRTQGLNRRITYGEAVPLGDCYLIFSRNEEGTFVQCLGVGNGQERYRAHLKPPAMYVVTPLYTQEMSKSPKEVRNLYNRLKASIGKPFFKIEANEKIRKPYMVKLHTWIDKEFKYEFTIRVKESQVSLSTVDEIYQLVDRASKLDLRTLLTYYNAFNENGMVVTVDEEFLALAETITLSHSEIASAK
jgi:hypothetical protein